MLFMHDASVDQPQLGMTQTIYCVAVGTLYYPLQIMYPFLSPFIPASHILRCYMISQATPEVYSDHVIQPL